MKALAFKVGGRTYCCSCSYRLANVTGFPHLFFATNRPSKVNAEAVCPRCGNYYGDPISQDAAVRIAAIVMGTEPTTAGWNWNRGGTDERRKMMDQAWLLAQYAEIEAVKADIEGMKALNQARIQRGESIAYDEDAFHEKALLLYGSAQLIMQNR